MSHPTRAGFCELDITPPLGGCIDGSCFRELPTQQMQDPLFLRAMALEDAAGQPLVIVTADLLYFPRDMSQRVARWANATLGLDPARLILNASHTHTGPFLHPVYDRQDVAYIESLEAAIRQGITQALDDLAPARVEHRVLRLPVGISRRRWRADGRAIDNSLLPNPQGHHDPDLPLLRVTDPTGQQVRGLLYSIACHPTARRGPYYSADFPGPVAAQLKRRLGQALCPLFAQGCGGDIKPRFHTPDHLRFIQPTWDELDAAGRRLADTLADAVADPTGWTPLALDTCAASVAFDLPYDTSKLPTCEQLAAWADSQSVIEDVSPLHRRYWSRLMLAAIEAGTVPTCHAMHATAWRLDDRLTLLALSDEVVAGIGTRLKAMFAPDSLITLGYCHHVEIYVPTAAMLDEGGYEPVRSLYYTLQHRLQPATLTAEVDAIIDHQARRLIDQVTGVAADDGRQG